MGGGKREIGQVVDFLTLEANVQDMIRRSVEVRERAYCPYSEFKVGAALMCDDGSVYCGCNVETGAHGSICAERTAIVKAVSEGKRKFTAIAVMGTVNDDFLTPCGTCRQFISEFGDNTVVYLAQPELKKVLISSIQELLPLSFRFNDNGY